jgi:hypothetical protein
VRPREPIQSDARKARRLRRLGAKATCILCGQENPECLERVDRSLLEDHHVVGMAIDPGLTVVVCRNCHASLSEGQRDAGIELRHDMKRSRLELLADVLDGLAILCEQLAPRLVAWADELRAVVTRLDRGFPEWRTME